MCLFPKKSFGFASLFVGEEHEVHVLGKEEMFLPKKKSINKINLIRLMFIFKISLNFFIWLFFINLNMMWHFKNAK